MGYFVWLQIKQIVPFWLLGLVAGAIASTYRRELADSIPAVILGKGKSFLKLILAAVIGAASPITIYGTLPLLAVLSRMKVRQSVISSFIVTSILINPNVFIFSFALGAKTALLRLLLSLFAGVAAGLLVAALFKDKSIYDFSGFACEQPEERKKMRDMEVIAANFNRAVLRTAPNLAIGIILSALFELYFPMDLFKYIFGGGSGLGVLFAASLGATTYYCGGGTIPLIMAWMNEGMSPGAAMAFMLTGPAAKLTNLTAVKTIMPAKGFLLYLLFSTVFGTAAGILIDLICRFTA